MSYVLRFVLIAISAIFILQSCTEKVVAPDKSFSFGGIVADADGQAISDALIELLSGENIIKSVKTDTSGQFELTDISGEISSMKLRISAEGYQTIIKSPDDFLKENKPNEIKILLNRLQEEDDCCGVINIRIVKYGTDTPIDDAEVKLTFANSIIGIEKTNDNGYVTFKELCEGKYFIRVAKDGYNVVEEYKILGECDTVDIEIGLKPKSDDDCCDNKASFIIKNEDGNPLSNVTVMFRRNGAVKYQGKTDENGKLTISDICKGEYSLLIKLEGYQPQEMGLTFDCKAELEKTITMKKAESNDCCNNTIKVTVKSAEGQLLSGVKLILWQNGKMVYYGYSEQGSVTIKDICKGKYAAELVYDGFKSVEWIVEFGCEQTLEFSKEMSKKENSDCCGKAYIYVKDDKTNSPIKNAEVKVTFNNTNKIAKTNDDGKVVFEELCKGKHWIRVAVEGYNVVEDYFYVESCDNIVEKTIKLQAKNSGDDCCDNQIKFEIKDESGNLLSNVQIKISKVNTIVATLKTQNGYAATDKKICKGEYAVRIYLEGYNVMEYTFSVDCDQIIEHKKTLTKKQDCCDAWVKVIPKDSETKETLNGAKVRIWKGGQLLKTSTVENGYVKFTDLCEGAYGFDIEIDGYKSIEFSADIRCNKENVFEKFMNKN